MNKLRIFFASLAITPLLFLGFGAAVSAQVNVLPVCDDKPDASICPDADQSQTTAENSLYGKDGIITKATNILSIIVGIAAVIVIVIAGIQYMLSTGDSAKVNNAKNAILYALAGIVVVVVARALVLFIVGRLA